MMLTNRSMMGRFLNALIGRVYDLLSAHLTQQATGGAITGDGSEQTLLIINEPLGCFKPLAIYVDLDAMQAGDTTVFRVYYRISDTGGFLLQDYQSFAGADGGLTNGKVLIAISLGPNRHGIKVTLQETVAGGRAYVWEAHVEA